MKEIKKKICLITYIVLFSTSLFSQSSRPIVSSITATVTDDNSAILVTWTIPENADFSNVTFLQVYRQTEEFAKKTTLINASLIGSVSTTTKAIKDKVGDYKNYWYAVIAKKTDGSVFDILIPSVNTTVLACKLQVPPSPSIQTSKTKSEESKQTKNEKTDEMRETPLPCLHILPLQTKQKVGSISPEAKNAAKPLEAQKAFQPIVEPYFFENEINGEKSTGSDYSLYYIIDSYFPTKDWNSAKAELIKFLQVARPDEIVARANFYLGEVYYYQEDYRRTIDCFLISEEIYKPISRLWLERTLNRYNMTN